MTIDEQNPVIRWGMKKFCLFLEDFAEAMISRHDQLGEPGTVIFPTLQVTVGATPDTTKFEPCMGTEELQDPRAFYQGLRTHAQEILEMLK